MLREYVHLILENNDKFGNLQPEDTLLMYHGTGESYLSMIHGIDATQEHHRVYGGPRHEGLFVSPDPETARRFASYGDVVLELEVKAKNLYGTDWSGNTAEKQIGQGRKDPNEIWKDRYPNSFRPYLSNTLSQGHEPQALFVGIIRPNDIRRVMWKGKWYSREELLEMAPEYYEPYSRTPTKLKKMSFDPTDADISIEEFYNIVSSMFSYKDPDGVIKVINSWKSRGLEELQGKIESLGWTPYAARNIANRLLS